MMSTPPSSTDASDEPQANSLPVRGAQAADLLVVGGANIDIVGRADHALGAGDSTPGHIRSAPGGVARNVAENLARLGHRPRLISAVGDDAAGRGLLHATQQAGVEVSGCRVVSGATTSTYLALHGAAGELALAMNDMRVLDQVDAAWLRGQPQPFVPPAAVMIDCNLQASALECLFAECGDLPVFVDTVSAHKCLRILPWLSRIHLIKPNRLEAQALTGLPLRDAFDAPAVAAWLHQRGVAKVAISLGEEGVFWSDGQASGLQPAPKVVVVNANGAGDALTAGLIHGWLQQMPLA